MSSSRSRRYTSPEAHDAHRATPHFEAFRALIKSHVLGGRFESIVTDTVAKDTFGIELTGRATELRTSARHGIHARFKSDRENPPATTEEAHP